ncbi:MAG: hypothetical protein ABDH91_08840 [Bacteroidia bacterium]
MPRRKIQSPFLSAFQFLRELRMPGADRGTEVEIEEVYAENSRDIGLRAVRLGMEEISGRADPNFWNPRWYDEAYEVLQGGCTPFPIHTLGEFLQEGTEGLTYGSTATGEERLILDTLPPQANPDDYVRYIKSKHVLRTGLDTAQLSWTPKDTHLAKSEYLVKAGDILMNKSGVGSAGRCAVAPQDWTQPTAISQHTMRIRLVASTDEKASQLSPYYLCLYFYTSLGVAQFSRWTSGSVGSVHIDFNELRQVLIPLLPRKSQERLAELYLSTIAWAHGEAMKASSPERRQGWLDTALGLMEVLIYQTEKVLRGTQKEWIALVPGDSRLRQALLKEYRVLGEYLREADEEGKSWVEKLFGLRLYRFPQKETLMEAWLQQLRTTHEKRLGQVEPIFSTHLRHEEG